MNFQYWLYPHNLPHLDSDLVACLSTVSSPNPYFWVSQPLQYPTLAEQGSLARVAYTIRVRVGESFPSYIVVPSHVLSIGTPRDGRWSGGLRC